jgi:molybdopterin molybdotransferase
VISLDDARAHVLERVAPLDPARVPLAEAHGCVLAEPLRAPEDVPPFANTAMDGYAVRALDTAGATDAAPVRLPVVAEVAAGHPAPRALQRGEAMRIFTGAPLPDGADAVVQVERTERLDGGAAVAVHAEVAPGTHLRHAGDDLRAGDEVFAAGELLSAAHVGVLASVGVTDPLVVPRPTVGVFSTGDELVEGPGPLRPGQIRDSNRRTLLALLDRAGVVGIDLGIVVDDADAIAAAIEQGTTRCDALVTTGGVSMGDIDLVRVVLDRLGDMRWMQIAIKPAKPFAFGVVAGIPVFGLPGNPVSSLVSFELLARPALRKMAGWSRVLPVEVPAVAAEPLRRAADGKTHFVRVVAERDGDGLLAARSAGGQGSHQLAAVARANALAVLPDGDGAEAGAGVRLILLADV